MINIPLLNLSHLYFAHRMFKLTTTEALEQQLTQHKDEDIYCSRVSIIVDPKKKKAEERIVLVGKHRIYLLKSPGGKVYLPFVNSEVGCSSTLARSTRGFEPKPEPSNLKSFSPSVVHKKQTIYCSICRN